MWTRLRAGPAVPETRCQTGHRHGHDGRVLANVGATWALGAGQGLGLVLGGEDPEGHRHTGAELDLLDAGSRLTGDQLVVGGLAADHAAEADDGVPATRGGEDPRSH